jgi:peptide chain release factor 1
VSLALLPEIKLGTIFDDASEIVVDIQFGVGGNDSKIFVEELLGIYLGYAKSLNFKADLLHSSDGHKIVKFRGDGVGRAFRFESGKHCIQRIPPTESKGRKQTSMVCVAVLPIKKDVYEPLRDDEIEVQTTCGHGPGGQHQNKTESAVRMRHIETGLTVFINGRDQHSNRREALSILTARVNDLRKAKNDAAYAAERHAQMGDGGRSDKIRTYNILEGRVVDHRLGTKTSNVKGVMKGQLDLIF